MNKFIKDHIKNQHNMNPKFAYEQAKIAWDHFRFERDEQRLLADLNIRLDKLFVKVDAFIEEHKAKLSQSMLESLLKSKNDIVRDSVNSLNEGAKTLFKVMHAAVTELNNKKTEETKDEKTEQKAD